MNHKKRHDCKYIIRILIMFTYSLNCKRRLFCHLRKTYASLVRLYFVNACKRFLITNVNFMTLIFCIYSNNVNFQAPKMKSAKEKKAAGDSKSSVSELKPWPSYIEVSLDIFCWIVVRSLHTSPQMFRVKPIVSYDKEV